MKTTPQHFCFAEDFMLLEGGVLYGFTGLKTRRILIILELRKAAKKWPAIKEKELLKKNFFLIFSHSDGH